MNNFKVGFGKSTIRFSRDELPIREFATKLDDLHCRVMLISGINNWALVSFELTSLRPAAIKHYQKLAAKLLAIDCREVWVTVTHTFAAPHLPSSTDSIDRKSAYQLIDKKLTESLIAACHQAYEDIQVVKIGQINVNCPLNINRNVLTDQGWWLGRNFEGYSNHQMRVLAFQKADKTTNLLVNYDIQQSVLDHLTDDYGERMISSDLMGNGIQTYEKTNGVAIFIPGCAGDQRPLFSGRNDQPFTVTKTLLANQADVITERLQWAVQNVHDWQPLRQLFSCQLSIEVPTQVQQQSTFEIKPTRAYNFKATGKTTTLHLWASQLNRYKIVGTEPELNSVFGDRCRRALSGDTATMIATLVNGAAKYLPEQIDFDRITYQSMNTQLGLTTDQRMLDACVQLKQMMSQGANKC
ncbi:hypothetical protein C6Y11_16675 [Lactiplantibacillus pentosus]|uniref:Neutral/alkaline non-lysosomal ceramidase N-terminal domain-containing protein n=1 Tax=Lactiplantibacillus pentosus IG1 TaxID=1042160 RepID=G0M5C7_LACPE|nr:hypothetical protein [Lactiplantibacillus pentosus]CCC17453.1 putative uncharacterized protein lp_3233 [Lactiplantibacillus pentosus IG1]MCT3282589.1 hypothetical protein [Lactiplantibacillus pentosus]MCT3301380.1 hypothetical protein [Lactiplantibacillus pentosus]PRO76070.1 hypothetical protein C6Y11_16675 [Lactiplantibacillus pentosus]PRO77366.1 hypothetical protein C6Y09_15860 [Lactiplantibacillus pentosus]